MVWWLPMLLLVVWCDVIVAHVMVGRVVVASML